MTLDVGRLPFSLDPLIAEARRRMRRRRLLALALTLALASASVGAVFAVRAPSAAAHTERLTAFFSVEGNAPRGVIVSYADNRSPTLAVGDGSVPFHANVSRRRISFYEFRARILTPGGHIACKIRLGSAVVTSHASGTNSLCVVKIRPPRGAGTGGGPDRASFDLEAPPKPAVTRAMVAAAHRDEARMLRLFVLPPGAQQLAHEPALLRRLGTKIFGVGPTSSDTFARFRYWRVRSSVAAATRFELRHQPHGAVDQGCPRPTRSTPLHRLCGIGMHTGRDLPANASLQFLFPRIRGLVGERELRVSILRLSSGWTGIRVAATNHTWIPRRFRHRAPLPIAPFVRFIRASGDPVAGQVFTGINLVVVEPKVRKLRWLRCAAAVGRESLRARERVSFAASPPHGIGMNGLHGRVEEVACSWHIPANAAGKRLRLRNYSEYMAYRGSHLNPSAIASVTATNTRSSSQLGSPEYSWTVRPPHG